MKHLNKPNFFIVGAPKSGTSALHEYLSQHSKVFVAPKEVHFFIDDFSIKKRVNSLNEYTSLFDEVKDEIAIGDASVWYLYSKSAAYNIKKYQSDAKIIIMLRNPIDMVYSLYYQLLYSGNENIDNFSEALQAEDSRKSGAKIPPNVSFVESLFYSEVAAYVSQIKRYLDVFGKKNVHIIIFDNFVNNTKREYLKVLNFLNIDQGEIPGFKVVNSNKMLYSKILNSFLFEKTFFKTDSIFFPLKYKEKISHFLTKLNTKKAKRPELDGDLKLKLINYYKKEIENLSLLLEEDLSKWYKIY